MSGRRPSLRSPWLGEGNTLAATGLSGLRRSLMAGSDDAPLAGDPLPGLVDGGQARRRDLDGFRRQTAGDLQIRVVVGHEPAVVPLELLVRPGAIGIEDQVRVVGPADMPG